MTSIRDLIGDKTAEKLKRNRAWAYAQVLRELAYEARISLVTMEFGGKDERFVAPVNFMEKIDASITTNARTGDQWSTMAVLNEVIHELERRAVKEET